MRHLIGMRCYCHGADGQPDPNCTDHENGGWLYVNEQRIIGLVTDISQRRELMETGAFFPGDAVFSPTSDCTISEGDKIIFTWPLAYGQGDAIERGSGATDRLYYEAVGALYCIDENKVFYVFGTDFQLSGKYIYWQWEGKSETAKAPRNGTRYSLKYTAYIEWIAFVPPVTRISAGVDMGNKVMLRKKHLIESK